jgi:hypothetical protein
VDGSLFEADFVFSRLPPEKIHEAAGEGSATWVSGWKPAPLKVSAVLSKIVSFNPKSRNSW